MSHLRKALSIWIQSGHTQAEFAKLTGIEQSICSRIFAGNRGFTLSQREAVFSAFSDVESHQGLIFLKADLQDQLPADAHPYLSFNIVLPSRLSEEPEPEGNPVEEARRDLISQLEEKDPYVLAIALALHEWRKKG